MNFNKLIKSVLIVMVVSTLIIGCSGKQEEPPIAEINNATNEVNAANTPNAQQYAAEQLKTAQESLETAKRLIAEKKQENYKDALINAIKAQIYAKMAIAISEIKSQSETVVDTAKKNESQAKLAEAKAKAEIEIVKSGLMKAKEVVPTLKNEINKILRELEDILDFDKVKKRTTN
ncbi:MAG: DUF4398 domain-containing protein [Candidatus Firestonebacteria bacterium]